MRELMVLILTMFLTIIMTSCSHAEDLNKHINVSNAEDCNILRTEVVNRIFKTDVLDTSILPVMVETNVVIPEYENATNLNAISRWTVTMPYGFKSTVTFFVPVTYRPEGAAGVIYHGGHGQKSTDEIYFIKQFVASGYTVACVDMPFSGINEPYFDFDHERGLIRISNHDQLSILNTLDFNSLSLFLLPVLATVNYFEKFGVSNIAMAGISGGGWTTDLYSALDKRIDLSFSIAGSMPIYIRSWVEPNPSLGDWEQYLPGLLDVLTYFDIYMLAGQNTKHHNIYIPYDDCCFGGTVADEWAVFLYDRMSNIGGAYSIFYDWSVYEHKVSDWVVNEILSIVVEEF